MSDDTWEFDDELVGGWEVLLRRIPKKPEHRTFDPELNRWVVGPGALRRAKNEGLSVHREPLVISLGVDPAQLYDETKYGSIGFSASTPRQKGAGVMETPQPEHREPNPILRASHADVRPPTAYLDKPFWKGIAYEISQKSWWVQPAD